MKLPIDKQPPVYPSDPELTAFWSYLRQWYYDEKRAWYELYDFIEHVGTLQFNAECGNFFAKRVNEALERENAGFRYINGQIAPITNTVEIQEIQAAATPLTTALKPVSDHINKALEHLSAKVNPDYANSMKEAIIAVEGVCRLVANMPDATLTPALEKTAKELDLHPKLREGMKNIFWYTCDDGGVRHANKDGDQPEQEDARFMLVTCSGFVNMVTEKARKQGKLPA